MVIYFSLQLGGGLLLGLGIWAVVGADSLKRLLTDDPDVFNAVYVIIAAGALLVVVGFFGCCGAIKENRCMLGTVRFCKLCSCTFSASCNIMLGLPSCYLLVRSLVLSSFSVRFLK